MSIASLIPLGAAGVAGVLGGKCLTGAAKGESFLDVLQTALLPSASSEQDQPRPTEAGAAAARSKAAVGWEENVAELSRRIRQRLDAAGIDLSVPVELRSDGLGGVLVDDPHPQRAEIEELLAADSELTKTFREVAAACTAEELTRSGSRWSEFRLQLDRNGGQAVFE